jgi:hypothetical protein
MVLALKFVSIDFQGKDIPIALGAVFHVFQGASQPLDCLKPGVNLKTIRQ